MYCGVLVWTRSGVPGSFQMSHWHVGDSLTIKTHCSHVGFAGMVLGAGACV